ncbi:MAG TPA: YciI family protein [Crinalium sp.]|jgi:hypothetical protein
MKFALQCILANDSSDKRIRLRTEHLRYIEAHKEQIFCGGPTLDDNGNPEMMLIILDVPDLASAEAFIQVEPYNRSGVFERITIRQWRQILPESHPGELLQQIQNH